METSWLDERLDRWRTKIISIVRHPLHSLVSLFAAIGGLIVCIATFLWRLARMLYRFLRRLVGMPLKKLFKGLAYAVVGFLALAFLITLILIAYPTTKVPDFQPVDQHVYLSQGLGWTGGQNEPLRQLFYYTPQGAGLKDIRYSWFVHLEVPWGVTRFADPERMSAYGFLVDNGPTKLNPDRMPVGFSSHYDPRFGENVLDLTCAACHTGELTVTRNGKKYGLRVDGAGAMHAFTAMHIGDFAPELMGSLMSTYLNPLKFNRFARRVLGPAYPQGRWKLHGDVRQVIGELMQQAFTDKSRHLYPTEEGPGRVDALGRIGNTLFGDELISANYRIGNAPVRYPPLWDIWKFDYVQYNAAVRQPMTRNVSESLGTGAVATLVNNYGAPIPPDDRFDSSVMMNNLNDLEMALWSLEPPRWNEDCMGKIDWERAKRGRVLFQNTCQHCHGPFPASEPIKEWFAYLKTSQHKCGVLDEWQKFMNEKYASAQEDRTPSIATPAPSIPPGEHLGLTLSPDKERDAEQHRELVATFIAIPAPSTLRPVTPGPSFTAPPSTVASSRPPVTQPAACTITQPEGIAPRIASDYDLPLWVMHPLTVEDVGTDPTDAVNFVEKTLDLTPLGLSTDRVNKVLRDVLEQDLFTKTNGYAKDILRLSGADMQKVNAMSSQDLRKAALDVVSRDKTNPPAARNSHDEDALHTDIPIFEDALTAGPSRIYTTLDSLDLSKVNTGVALSMIVYRARQRFYATRRYEDDERNTLNGFGQRDVPVALAQYKPRPLAGIWAAGPFLHNGSVPTIYQLLLPAEQRDKKFFVGTRDFDPVNLGLSTDAPHKNGFWLDTSITGNSNIGHEFRNGYIEWKPGSPPQYGVIGPELSEEDRRDLLEYLKIHRDDHTRDPANDLDGYLREGLDTRNVCQ
ncbi:MAG: di-heme-cytochrome C peroxidase [Terriglobales bacterium]